MNVNARGVRCYVMDSDFEILERETRSTLMVASSGRSITSVTKEGGIMRIDLRRCRIETVDNSLEVRRIVPSRRDRQAVKKQR